MIKSVCVVEGCFNLGEIRNNSRRPFCRYHRPKQTPKKLTMIDCLNCGITIEVAVKDNRKFCGRNCSTAYNNTKGPNRQRPRSTCAECGKPVSTSRKYCSYCWEQIQQLAIDKLTLTLDDLTVYGGRKPDVYSLARKVYKDSGLSRSCLICGYAVHVEIAHIKAVASFAGDTLMSEINCIDNLMALCRNHHWEYDNKILETDEVIKIRKLLK